MEADGGARKGGDGRGGAEVELKEEEGIVKGEGVVVEVVVEVVEGVENSNSSKIRKAS